MGKTLINLELRNELVDFLGGLEDRGDDTSAKAADLYNRLKPQRNRKPKVVKVEVA
jgi:hypothetical protein